MEINNTSTFQRLPVHLSARGVWVPDTLQRPGQLTQVREQESG
jgi:hypothetical protein